jgi:hypothetical protein
VLVCISYKSLGGFGNAIGFFFARVTAEMGMDGMWTERGKSMDSMDSNSFLA